MTSGCLWLWLTVLARERKVSIRLVGLHAEPAIRAVRRAACLGEQAAVSGQPAYATVANLSPSRADSGPFQPSPADLLEEKMPSKFGTYWASSAPSAGLKILVSALQSRPVPRTRRARIRLSDLRDRADADEPTPLSSSQLHVRDPLCDFE